MCGIKLALLAQNGPNWRILRAQGELYTAYKAKTGLAITAHQAPLLRRAPEGPEGQATKPVGGGGQVLWSGVIVLCPSEWVMR